MGVSLNLVPSPMTGFRRASVFADVSCRAGAEVALTGSFCRRSFVACRRRGLFILRKSLLTREQQTTDERSEKNFIPAYTVHFCDSIFPRLGPLPNRQGRFTERILHALTRKTLENQEKRDGGIRRHTHYRPVQPLLCSVSPEG